VNEILPGVFHWTAYHQRIRQPVSSYHAALDGGATLIDPMLPEGGIGALRERGGAERIVLTNRHHLRHSVEIAEEFGCPILCERSGLHEFEDGPGVQQFEFGDEVAPGIVALEVGSICSEDSALHLRVAEGALAFADGLVRFRRGEVGFVPDFLLGGDPEGVKRGLRESLGRLLDRDFDHLLFAHGEPLVGGGKRALREFVEGKD
jgi:hypothetical protein